MHVARRARRSHHPCHNCGADAAAAQVGLFGAAICLDVTGNELRALPPEAIGLRSLETLLISANVSAWLNACSRGRALLLGTLDHIAWLVVGDRIATFLQ